MAHLLTLRFVGYNAVEAPYVLLSNRIMTALRAIKFNELSAPTVCIASTKYRIYRTVLPAKSSSDVMFCLLRYQGLKLCINPILRINTQVIYRLALAQVECTS